MPSAARDLGLASATVPATAGTLHDPGTTVLTGMTV
jgi:hypothetical protein